ncbi:GTP pyrophosphokinase [Larkinella sp. GY13]|uniref:GTP pyrophosphokinase n=1 Tax=Larkinella sp. GY13 TaxID=3453720 RepID=UPI003EEB162F
MNQEETREKELRMEFRTLLPHLESWGNEVDKTLKEILHEFILTKKVQIGPAFRVKDEDKYIEKVTARKAYNNPLIETSDKVGTRVVLLNTKDLVDVSDVLMNHDSWNITKDREWLKEVESNPSTFDYQSEHFVVTPKKETLLDIDFNALKCEIQIRTLLQHAYAEVSHDHVYKGAYKNDKPILRKLAKSMALMEATDDYFNQIFDLIGNPNNKENDLLKNLGILYKHIVPEKEVYYSQDLSDLYLPLFYNKPFNVGNLDGFVENNAQLKNWINRSNLLLFKHPIIIMLAYFLRNDQDYLCENWPSTRSQLEGLHLGLGYSFSDY